MPSHINYHLAPPHTDSVPPSSNRCCPILTQYSANHLVKHSWANWILIIKSFQEDLLWEKMSFCPAWTSGPHNSCGLAHRLPGEVRPRPQADRQQQWQRQHCQLPSPMPKYWHKSIVDIIKYWAQGWPWNILTIFDGVLLTKRFTRPWLWVLEEMRQTLIVILVRWRL